MTAARIDAVQLVGGASSGRLRHAARPGQRLPQSLCGRPARYVDGGDDRDFRHVPRAEQCRRCLRALGPEAALDPPIRPEPEKLIDVLADVEVEVPVVDHRGGVHEARSISADQAHHLVEVHWWETPPDAPGVLGDRHYVVITARTAIELARSLIQAAHGALDDVIDDVARGECARCGNLRMIDVPRSHGHGTERVHCDVCVVDVPLAPVPTTQAWRDTEARMDPRGPRGLSGG